MSGERPDGRRLALIIATGSYTDPELAPLKTAHQDADDLEAVLRDPAIGGYEVTTVLDGTAETIRHAIAELCEEAGRRDLVLVYLSCHGVLDARGRLYFA